MTLQLSLLDADGVQTGDHAEIQWIEVSRIEAHPDNPRLFIREEVVEGITSSIKEKGFDPCYAVLVRPLDSGHQMISGHHRLEACRRAGVKHIAAWVRDMDDETAFMELVLANNQGELSPIEYGMHVLKYVELSEGGRGKKGGLSEYARLIGKDRTIFSKYQSAASVFKSINLCNVAQVLDKANHLAAIHKAPESDWPWLVAELLDKGWSVRDTEAAVGIVCQICDIPEWLHPVFPPDEYKRKAIGAERLITDLKNWTDEAIKQYEQMPEKQKVDLVVDDEHQVEYWDLKQLFIKQLLEMKSPSATRIRGAAAKVLSSVDALDEAFKQWQASKASEDERRKAEEAERLRLLKLAIEFAPVGHCGDLRDVLPGLEKDFFDLVLTDPPYLLSNGGITCRGNSQVTVDKNFADSAGEAIDPLEWMPLCFQLLKPGGILVITLTRHLFSSAEVAAEDAGFKKLHDMAWVKRSAPPRLTPTGPRACHEYVLSFAKPGAAHYYAYEYLSEKYWKGKQPDSVLEFEQCSGKERLGWHDTQKPISLWTYLLESYCPEGGAVLDPFSGSGTTAVTAKMTGRKCTWVELDQDFYGKSNSRIEHIKFPWEA